MPPIRKASLGAAEQPSSLSSSRREAASSKVRRFVRRAAVASADSLEAWEVRQLEELEESAGSGRAWEMLPAETRAELERELNREGLPGCRALERAFLEEEP